jgi:hypothetical protein
VESITDDEVVFRNYQGRRFVYKQPKVAPSDGCGGDDAAPDIVPIEIAKTAKAAKAVTKSRRRRALVGPARK